MKLQTLKNRAGLFLAATLATALIGVAPANAADRHVRLINETSHTLVHFYASNTDVDSWQEDILGSAVLKPGQEVNINIDDGTGHCTYDFKSVFDNGAKVTKNNVNVCQVATYRITD